jgi:phosphoenolpyruvate carboxykinase (GTP)
LAWLERLANNEVNTIETPIGYLPKFDDLYNLFRSIIDKDYTQELYVKQFSLYIDNIVARIDMQKEAYGKEPGISGKLLDILKEQKEGLLSLKKTYGSVVTPSQLEEF